MKKLFAGLTLLVLLLSLVLTSTASCFTTATPPDHMVLKIAQSLPEGNLQVMTIQEMAARFNERAAAYNYSIEVYPGGALCSMEESFDMVRTGAVEISDIGLSYATTQDARFGAVGLPFTIDDIDANARYVGIITDALFADIMEERFNQKIIAEFLSPPLDYCGNQPIETLEDWSGLLIQGANPIQMQTIEDLGASAVSMPFYDMVPSLEKGLIDGGVGVNAYAINMLNWFDSFTDITVAIMFGGYICMDINLDAFNAMPEEVQAILLEEGEWLSDEMTVGSVAMNVVALAECEKNGISVNYLSEEERDRWCDATRSVVDDFFAMLDPADVAIIQDAIDEANS